MGRMLKRVSFLLVLAMLFQLFASIPIYAEDAIEVYGDLNGDGGVNAIDFAALRGYLIQANSPIKLVPGREKYADLYKDGAINALDFAIFRKYMLGMIDTLPYIPSVTATATPTTSTPTPQSDWVPYVPKPEDVSLSLLIEYSAEPRSTAQKYINVNITLWDAGYRIVDDGKLITSTTDQTFTTQGVKAEKYIGSDPLPPLASMQYNIRYPLDTYSLKNKNHFDFRVGDTIVTGFSFTQNSIIPPTPVPYGAEVNKDFVNANTQFAANLFKKLSKEDSNKNVFFSPFSISMALSMVYQGAETTTKEAMANVLNYNGMSTEEINQSYMDHLKYFKNLNSEVQLNIANSIWVNQDFKVNNSFLVKNEEVFNSKVSYLDFGKSDACDIMNKWISDSTKGKIDKMLIPPISTDIIMYLMNAIYFNGSWTDQFDKRLTSDSTFTNINGEKKLAPMMNKFDNYKYVETDEYRAVELPYGSGSVSMYCILPETGNVNDFIAEFNNSKWLEIKSKLSLPYKIDLSIPRFKIEYKPEKLKDKLKELGMEQAFSYGADFSGIGKDVWISDVEHKAVIDVNETGTEAAAVTVIGVAGSAMPNTFIADKPFMFVIADNATGTVLFMGKVADLN